MARKALQALVHRHPFLLSVVVTCAVVTPWYWLQTREIRRNEARAVLSLQIARQVRDLYARADQEQAQDALLQCREANLALYRYRAMLRRLIEALAVDSGNDARVLKLRELVPADEDTVDCDADGAITPSDYGMAEEAR